MSVALALETVGGGMGFFRRQHDRMVSGRVATSTDEDEEGSFINSTQEGSPSHTDLEQGVPDGSDSTEEEEEESSSETDGEGVAHFVVRPSMSLQELEDEREQIRRRSSGLIMFATLGLVRMWIFALDEGDLYFFSITMLFSFWAIRWIRHNREQEEDLDRRIANYLQLNEDTQNENEDRRISGSSLRALSFQAQLALAIMESQQQMMQGGYGHPDGEGNQTPGVSEEAKAKWTKFAYKAIRDKNESRRGSYGALSQDELKTSPDEEPHCSICLGEYEEGEDLCKLPCSHIYHDECINSWCSNHTRCPLCNLDLESSSTSPETSEAAV